MSNALIIDDDDLCRMTIRSFLGTEDTEIMEATTGVEGQRYAILYKPDIIFCDIFMPDQDGLETIRNIRRYSKIVPIVAISGGGRDRELDYLKHAKLLGATYAIPKPLSYNVIKAITSRTGINRVPMQVAV